MTDTTIIVVIVIGVAVVVCTLWSLALWAGGPDFAQRDRAFYRRWWALSTKRCPLHGIELAADKWDYEVGKVYCSTCMYDRSLATEGAWPAGWRRAWRNYARPIPDIK